MAIGSNGGSGGGGGSAAPRQAVSGGGCASLSPMDEYHWFEPIRVVYSLIGPGSQQQLAPLNVRRVALQIGINGSTLWIAPDPTLVAAGSTALQLGMALNTGAGVFTMTQESVGNLCQAEWWGAVATGSQSVRTTIVEVLLRDWPKGRPACDPLESSLILTQLLQQVIRSLAQVQKELGLNSSRRMAAMSPLATIHQLSRETELY